MHSSTPPRPPSWRLPTPMASTLRRKHYLKADAATSLHRRLLRHDFGPPLRQLNQTRKKIWYEGDEPDFDRALEDILADVEALVEEAEGAA